MTADLADFEIARALRKHPRTIQRWCKAGKLSGAYRAGRSWRIPRKALRSAQLGGALAPDELERELKAATHACLELSEELDAFERGGARLVRNWRSLERQLRQLQVALGDLPERADKAQHAPEAEPVLPAGWPSSRRPSA